MKYTEETVLRALNSELVKVTQKDIASGVQLRLPEGTNVNFYPGTGKVLIQGKDGKEKLRAQRVLDVEPDSLTASSKSNAGSFSAPEKIFIVYGHDTDAREQLELLLRHLRLEPVILANLPSKGQTIIEKLEEHREVKYACVLLTPDDQGNRRDHPSESRPRARQNAVLEMGMFLATLGRNRAAILHKSEIELPSDISGLVYIPFKKHVSETKDILAAELQEAGFQIKIKDLLGNK
jgi:predicted nucleotide-binding protein